MPRKDPESRREYMKEYHKKYDLEYYQKHKDRYKIQKTARRKMIKEWFDSEILSGLRCKCGEDHWACLEFHHRDPAQKDMHISDLRRGTGSKKRILEEVAKCDVMCANCHRKLHFP